MTARDMYLYCKGKSPMPPQPKMSLSPFMAMVFMKIRNASRSKLYRTDIVFELNDYAFEGLRTLNVLDYTVFLFHIDQNKSLMFISWEQENQIFLN